MSFVLVPYFIDISNKHFSHDMKKSFVVCFLMILFSMVLGGCGDGQHDDSRTVVESFANAYFNWRFKEAESYVTNESRKWLVFAASQVDSEDVDSLRAMEFAATAEVEHIEDIDDSTSLATVKVVNFLASDSIGKHPQIQAEQNFQIPVTFDGKHWRVKLTHLP